MRVTVIGEAAFGKTTFCIKAQTNEFREDRYSNVSVELYKIKHQFNGEDYDITLIDLPGQVDRFNFNITYTNNTGLFLIFINPKIIDTQSKCNKYISEWIQRVEVRENIPIVIVASFSDEFEQYPLDIEQLKKDFEKKGVVDGYIISSKTGANITDVINSIVVNYQNSSQGTSLEASNSKAKNCNC